MSEFKPKRIGRYSRLFLLVLSEVNLLLGVLFYAYPNLVIGLWPWPVKELAVRFLGAIFLAITLGCWSALRANGWQRGKVLTLVGGVFFGITAIITVFQIPAQGANWTILVWITYFAFAAVGLFAIIQRHGWSRRSRDMISQGPPLKVASLFFRIQTIVVGLFGTLMLFLPDLAQGQFWPWHVATPTLQTFAALFLATCLATGWAVRQTDRGRILGLIPLDGIFPAMALLAVAISWDVITRESPSLLVTGVWVFLYSFVAAGSTYLFLTLRREPKSKSRTHKLKRRGPVSPVGSLFRNPQSIYDRSSGRPDSLDALNFSSSERAVQTPLHELAACVEYVARLDGRGEGSSAMDPHCF